MASGDIDGRCFPNRLVIEVKAVNESGFKYSIIPYSTFWLSLVLIVDVIIGQSSNQISVKEIDIRIMNGNNEGRSLFSHVFVQDLKD